MPWQFEARRLGECVAVDPQDIDIAVREGVLPKFTDIYKIVVG